MGKNPKTGQSQARVCWFVALAPWGPKNGRSQAGVKQVVYMAVHMPPLACNIRAQKCG